MKVPVFPHNETARLQALHELAVLDTPPEERFDRLTRLAKQFFDTPIALISLVDSERQWFKSKQGLDACETPRNIAFCAHAILDDDILYVPDAQKDERFADNPAVSGPPNVRFYAGYPLTTPEGFRIGTLCIVDTKPREFTAEQLQVLQDLGKCVEDELLQARVQKMAHSFNDQEVYLRAVLDTVHDGIISIDSNGIIQTVNPSTSILFGYEPEEMIGRNVRILMPTDQARRHDNYIRNYLSSGEGKIIGIGRELMGRRKDGSTFPIVLEVRPMQQQTGHAHFVGIVRDIESRKLAERSYQRARDRLNHFLSVTPGVIFACRNDKNYTISFVSDNAIKVMGYSSDEFLNNREFWQTHLHPEDKDWVFEQLQLLNENYAITCTFRMRHAQDNYRWLKASLHLLSQPDNKENEIVGMLTDITNEKRIQDEISQSHRLLDAISRAQAQFISDADTHAVFEELLKDLLQLSESEFGFIAEVYYTPEGVPYLKSHAITNIAWDDDTRKLYNMYAQSGLEFRNLNSLFGEVLKTGKPVITNDARNDSRRSGLPNGHPPMMNFLGQPFFLGEQLIGVLGIANRSAGYNEKLASFLNPLLRTCAKMIEALRNENERKKTVRELNRFKHTLDQTLDMIFIFDAETLKFEYLNDGAVHSMGYTRDELLQMTPYDIKPQLTRTNFIEKIRPLKDGEKSSLNFETIHQRKDGSEFPVEIFLQLVHEQTDELRYIAIVRDISERRQAEQDTRMYTSTLERLHSINTNVKLDHSGRILAILQLGCEVFGLPRGVVSQIHGNLYHIKYAVGNESAANSNDKITLENTYCSHTLQLGQPLGINHVANSHFSEYPAYQQSGIEAYLGTPLFTGSTPYGSLNFTSTTPLDHPFNAHHYSLIQLFSQWIGNILEEDRIRSELSNVNSLRKAILDSANFSIISTDTDGIIKTFNKGAQRMLGYSEVEIINKVTPAIIHVTDEVVARAKSLSQELGKPINPGFEVFVAKSRLGIADESEWTYIRKDGSRFPVLLSVTALRDKNNNITGFLGIGSDITERKRMDRMKNEFISTVSHELRTPLTSIRGALTLVLNKSAGDLSPKVLNMLQTASRNSERLSLLINDILDLEKIETGRLEFDFREIDLVNAARQALEANEAYALQHNIKIHLNTECDHAIVMADNHRLQQVFANLISNAVKFSHAGGEVVISISRRNDKYHISVLDQGRGIPLAFHDRIFQRFAQADSSDTREKGGTGLGLSITRAIIERLDGKIDFNSREGVGTEFYFDLPVFTSSEHSITTITSS